MNLIEQEFISLVYEITSDIGTMDALQDEMLFFHEALRVADGVEATAEASEDFEFALSQYHGHKDHLLNMLETWMDHTKRLNMPTDINFFRILKQLREMEKAGQ